MSGYLTKLEEKGFEELILVQDSSTGLKGAIAIHNTVRGPALGGTRMWAYPSEEAAIDDVMHLARGMSYKAAAAELPLGGGKGVIIGDPEHDKCEKLFRAYGRCVEKLNGRFVTAADMGIGEEDLDCMRKECKHIIGGSAIGSPSPYTAYGVWKGIKAYAGEVFGSTSLKDKVVAIQGIGSVGSALCQHLADEGAHLIVTDIDEQRLKKASDLWNATIVKPEEIYSQQCDIFSPCAAGGVVNEQTISQFKCSIIAGAANNIIKDMQYGAALKERGIYYAPDYIINAGGLIFVWMTSQGITDTNQIKTVIDNVADRLIEIFRRSRDQNKLPQELADIFAEERLQRNIN